MRARVITLAFLLTMGATAQGPPPTTPSQYYYTEDNARNSTTAEGCVLAEWEGTDPDGMAGYPWLTKVACPNGTKYVCNGLWCACG